MVVVTGESLVLVAGILVAAVVFAFYDYKPVVNGILELSPEPVYAQRWKPVQ